MESRRSPEVTIDKAISALTVSDELVRSPSRLCVLKLPPHKEPDVTKLAKLLGRSVTNIDLRTYLEELYAHRSVDGDKKRWRTGFGELIGSGNIVLMGPLEDLISMTPIPDGYPSDRQLQIFLCNLVNLIPPAGNTFVLYSRTDPRRLEIGVETLRMKLKLSRVVRSELDLVEYLWSDSTNVSGGMSERPTRDEKLMQQIAALVHAHKSGDKDRLTSNIVSLVSKHVDGLLHSLDVIDPRTGLVIPPAPRTNYGQRGKEFADLNAPQFLERVWGDYLGEGLLYTGHLKKLDPSLYNAIIYLARQTARGRAEVLGIEWSPSATSEILFSKFKLLTEDQLRSPPAELSESVELIKRAIQKQKRPVRERLEFPQDDRSDADGRD